MNYYIRPEYAPVLNGLYLFEKNVNLQNDGKAQINIFAASRYILYINDTYVCEGPCRGPEQVRYYDNVEFDLKKGENHIVVKVLHVTDFFASVDNTPTPMLVFEATVGEEVISSDKTWSCKYLKGYEYRTYQMRGGSSL